MKKGLRKYGPLALVATAAIAAGTLGPLQLGEDTTGSTVESAYNVPAIWRFAYFDYVLSGVVNPPPMAVIQEGQDVTSVEWKLTNRNTGSVVYSYTDSTSPFCLNSACSGWDSGVFPNGYYTLEAIATRQDGSKSGRKPIVYLYNATAPENPTDPGASSAFDIVNVQPDLTGTVDPGPGAVTKAGYTVSEYLFELKDNGGAVVKAQTERVAPYCLNGNSNAANTECGPWDTSLFANGAYTLAVTATLGTGQTETQNYAFTITNAAPGGSEPNDYDLYVDASNAGAEDGTQANPYNTITEAVSAAVDGNKIWVRAGTYREVVTINKPNLTLSGADGAIIKGSDVKTGWVQNGLNWEVAFSHTNPTYTGTPCVDGTNLCQLPEQVYMNGTHLTQTLTLSDLDTAGEFHYANGILYIRDDPTGDTVEVSTRPYWVIGSSGLAANTTIEGFTMLHAAQSAQRGSFKDNNNDGWIVRNNEFSYGGGLQISGNNSVVTNNDIHHNIQNGITTGNAGDTGASCTDENSTNCMNSGQRWEFNNVYSNNINNFNAASEGGGSKFSRARNLIISNNNVYENNGYGIWCDVFCDTVTISNNKAYENAMSGISYEISRNCTIQYNDVWENGAGRHTWAFGTGILIQNSSNCTVFSNYLAWNWDGIVVVQQDRGSYTVVENVLIDDNWIVQEEQGDQPKIYAWSRASGTASNMFEAQYNNRGQDNRFYRVNNPVFEWTSNYTTLSSINATPACQNTCTEPGWATMEAKLIERGIPTTNAP